MPVIPIYGGVDNFPKDTWLKRVFYIQLRIKIFASKFLTLSDLKKADVLKQS